MKVETALAILDHNPKHPAVPLRKLLLSAISNWKQKNEGADESGLVVKTIFVDGARVIKRMRPAPQGRGYRVRKRSNHVTIIVDTVGSKVATAPAVVEDAVVVEEAPVTKKAKTTKKA